MEASFPLYFYHIDSDLEDLCKCNLGLLLSGSLTTGQRHSEVSVTANPVWKNTFNGSTFSHLLGTLQMPPIHEWRSQMYNSQSRRQQDLFTLTHSTRLCCHEHNCLALVLSAPHPSAPHPSAPQCASNKSRGFSWVTRSLDMGQLMAPNDTYEGWHLNPDFLILNSSSTHYQNCFLWPCKRKQEFLARADLSGSPFLIWKLAMNPPSLHTQNKPKGLFLRSAEPVPQPTDASIASS